MRKPGRGDFDHAGGGNAGSVSPSEGGSTPKGGGGIWASPRIIHSLDVLESMVLGIPDIDL